MPLSVRERLKRLSSNRTLIAAAATPFLLAVSVAGCNRPRTTRVAPVVDIPRFPVEKFTLSNGLRVLLSVDRSAPVVALDVHYHVGSKNEVAGRTGFAHFFEHLMFEGSANVPSGGHKQILAEGGGTGSAFTYVDYTEYYNVFPSNYLETALWLESDRMGFFVPYLSAERLKPAREVVNNERRQNYLNPTFGVQPLIAMPAVYPAGHPYSWRTIGYEEDLAKAQLADVREFFTRYYVPNNAVLTIVGDIDVAETRAMVEKYFGGLPRGGEVSRPAAPPATLATNKRVVLEDPKARLPQITFIWPTVGVHDADEIPLLALGAFLTGDRNSRTGDRTARLTKLLVYDRALATGVQAYQGSDELAGEFYVEVFPRQGVTLTQIETVVDSMLAATASAPATAIEMQRLTNYMTVDKITNLQSVLEKSRTLALSEIFFGDPHRYVKEAQGIMAVQPSDIDRVVTRYLSKGHVVISMVPAGKLDLISRPDAPYTNVTPVASAPVPK